MELGKYVDLHKYPFQGFFQETETQRYFSEDQEIYVVERDFVKLLIEGNTALVRNYYVDLLSPIFDRTGWRFKEDFEEDFDIDNLTKEQKDVISRCLCNTRDIAIEWGLLLEPTGKEINSQPFNLGEEDKSITTSWKYEYNTFELVRIYKHFDFENNVLIYYGY
jgi:hypothetical protein